MNESLKIADLRAYLASDIPADRSPCFASSIPITSDLCKHYVVAEKPSPEDRYFRVFPCLDERALQRKDAAVGIPVWQHLDDAISAELRLRAPEILRLFE